MFTASALALAVASSVAWAGFDLGRKMLAGHLSALALTALIVGAQVPLFLIWVLIDGVHPLPGIYALPATVSIVVNVIANITFIRALQIAPLSLTIPFLAFTPLLTAMTAYPSLAELPGPVQIAGIVLVVIGGLTLGREGDDAAQSWWLRVIRCRGSWMMIGVATLWSLAGPFDKMAMRYVSVPMHSFVVCTGIALALFAYLIIRGRLSELLAIRHHPGAFAFSVIAAGLGLTFQLWAFKTLLVSVVEAIKRTIGMLMALANGRIFFHEPLSRLKVGAVALMCLGVVLILVRG